MTPSGMSRVSVSYVLTSLDLVMTLDGMSTSLVAVPNLDGHTDSDVTHAEDALLTAVTACMSGDFTATMSGVTQGDDYLGKATDYLTNLIQQH